MKLIGFGFYKLLYPVLLSGFLLSLNSCNVNSENGGETVKLNPQLKACSFNIRYDTPADAPNQWENRKTSVVNFLAIEDPDLIGFQEVLAHQLEYMKSRLTQYENVGVGREDGVAAGEHVPCSSKKVKNSASEFSAW